MLENLKTYSVPELRKMVSEHNKKIKKEVTSELKVKRKEMRAAMLKERLIDIKGIKDKDVIMKIMIDREVFKDVEAKKILTKEERQIEIDTFLKPLVRVSKSEYKKNKDDAELNKSVKEILKKAKMAQIKTGLTQKKLFLKIKEAALKNKIVIKEKPKRPDKPTRKAPKLIERKGKKNLIVRNPK